MIHAPLAIRDSVQEIHARLSVLQRSYVAEDCSLTLTLTANVLGHPVYVTELQILRACGMKIIAKF